MRLKTGEAVRRQRPGVDVSQLAETVAVATEDLGIAGAARVDGPLIDESAMG